MSFNIDEIKLITKQVLHEKIGEKEFLYESIRQWHIEILTEILDRLKRIHYHQQIKYIVTVLIGEKTKDTSFGLHTALSCLWDGTTDGCVTVKWENQFVFSIVTVFGLTI